MVTTLHFTRPNREKISVSNLTECCTESELEDMTVADAAKRFYEIEDASNYTVFADGVAIDPDDAYLSDLDGEVTVTFAPKIKAAA